MLQISGIEFVNLMHGVCGNSTRAGGSWICKEGMVGLLSRDAAQARQHDAKLYDDVSLIAIPTLSYPQYLSKFCTRCRPLAACVFTMPFRALIKTHHMTSRKKIQTLSKAAKTHACSVVFKTGRPPGVMIAEAADESSLTEWVDTVKVSSQYAINL